MRESPSGCTSPEAEVKHNNTSIVVAIADTVHNSNVTNMEAKAKLEIIKEPVNLVEVEDTAGLQTNKDYYNVDA